MVFWLAPLGYRHSDLDNLARPVLDTLFRAQHVQAKVPGVSGTFTGVPDERVDRLVLEKRPGHGLAQQGVDLVVRWPFPGT